MQLFNSLSFLTPISIAITLALLGLFLYLIYRTTTRRGDKFEELYLRIHEDIKYAVAPKSIQVGVAGNELIELATEIWRMEQRLTKVADTLPENHKKGLENSMSKLKRYISNYDIEIIDYTNQKFNDGLNLDVLSVDKDPSVTTPIVKETVEPTIMMKGQVVKKAKIILLSN